jgi:hypothetical protein
VTISVVTLVSQMRFVTSATASICAVRSSHVTHFGASSLNKKSYPIEIARVFEDGRSRSFLIRPAKN